MNEIRLVLNFMKIGQLVTKSEDTHIHTQNTANTETSFVSLNEGKYERKRQAEGVEKNNIKNKKIIVDNRERRFVLITVT
jgi:hypothetical protein